jgi:protein-S-isoprenylcysteine O-methyltransferase Ste14
MRTLRLKLVWLLVVPFLWFARPTAPLLLAGAVLGLLGLLVRGWAAGSIRKEAELCTWGPYAHVRNPLYLGSLLLGTGITLAGGSLVWVGLFLAFYLTVYTRTIAGEVSLLTELFGERYTEYSERVPGFVPRLIPDPGGAHDGEGFSFARYRRNNEWEALAGALAVFAYLTLRWWLGAAGA